MDDTGSLGFQNDVNRYVTLTLASGTLSSPASTVYLWEAGGEVQLTPNQTAICTLAYSGIDTVNVQGDNDNALRAVPSGSTIRMYAGNSVLIRWAFSWDPYLPITFIMGMCGLVMVTGGGMYSVSLYKKHEYHEMLVKGITWVSIGLALTTVWLAS